MRDPYTAQTRYAISSNMLLYVLLSMQPKRVAFKCLDQLIYGLAYSLSIKEEFKTFSAQGLSWFVKTTVIKKLKRKFK